MLHTLSFFSSKCRLFHNATFFGSCVIHILYTGSPKIKKKIRRQRVKPGMDGTGFETWTRTTPFCFLETSRAPMEPKQLPIKICTGFIFGDKASVM